MNLIDILLYYWERGLAPTISNGNNLRLKMDEKIHHFSADGRFAFVVTKND